VRENTRGREYVMGVKGKNRVIDYLLSLGTERFWQREKYLFSEELCSTIIWIQSL
jgi:hypothetical protein